SVTLACSGPTPYLHSFPTRRSSDLIPVKNITSLASRTFPPNASPINSVPFSKTSFLLVICFHLIYDISFHYGRNCNTAQFPAMKSGVFLFLVICFFIYFLFFLSVS